MPEATAVEAVFFDLDGTLADTAPDLAAAVNRLRREHGLAELPYAALRPFASAGARGMLRAAFGIDPGHREYAARAERFLALYELNLCARTSLFEGIHQVLSALDNAPLRWGIVTNKHSRFTVPLLAKLALDGRPCCIVSGDEAARAKPAPDLLLLAARQSGVDAGRCLYVGDDPRDIRAGRAAGMRTVAAAYGYLGETPPGDWAADAIIGSPRELLPVIGLSSW